MVLALVVLVITVVGVARPAGAHATLLSASPVADSQIDSTPEGVELRFSEPVAVTGSGLRVFAPDGRRVERAVDRLDDNTVLRAAIDDAGLGTYTVAWRVTSDDGHTISGSFVFHVRTITGGTVIADAGTPAVVRVVGFAARWTAFSGTLLVAGALTVALLVLEADVRRRLRRLALAAAIAAALGAGLNVVVLNAQATGRGLIGGLGLLGDFVGGQRTGQLGLLRGLALAVTAVLISAAGRARLMLVASSVAVAAAMAITAVAGHAWTVSPSALAVASDVVHQAAAGIWVGGVAALFLVISHVAARGRLVARFSRLALWTAVAVGATGVVSSWLQVRSIDALTQTTHGRLLIGKMIGFGVLLAIGWRNRSRFIGRVEHDPAPLVRSLRMEAAAALAVLGLTAALVAQQPARLALTRPYESSLRQGDLTIQLSVQPARTGPNDIHLYFFDRTGGTLAAVDAVQIDAAVGDIPPRRLKVTPISPNHVSAYGASLSAGLWTLTATVVRAGTASTFSMEVPIR